MALSEDFTVPNLADGVPTQLSSMRDNWWRLIIAVANGAKVAAGWTTVVTSASSPLDYAHPDSMELTQADTSTSPNTTKTLHFDYTWSGDNLTQIVIKYGNGTSSPQLVTITGGTITLTYDGSGNFTGATSA